MFDRNFFMMMIGAIIIGFSPIVTKAVDLAPTVIGFYRFFFGALGMGAWLLISRTPCHLESYRKALPFVAGAGLMFAVDLWFWHRSIIYIGAGIATLLANTQIFYLVVLSWVLFQEKPRWFFYIGLGFAFVGLCLTTWPYIDLEKFDTNFYGVLFGLLTGLSYALVTVCLKKAVGYYKGRGPWIIFGVTAFSSLFTLGFSLLEGNASLIQGRDLFLMILYGVGIHFMGWLLISKAIISIPVILASLLLLLQPVFATIFGNLIYDEILSWLQVLGLILSLAGIFISSTAKAT